MPCQGGHSPAPEIHWALLLPGSRQAAAGPIRGWTQCRGWAHGLPPRGSHGDAAHCPGAGWAPPVPPPPHRQHPAGPSPCAAPGTRIPPASRVPPCPESPRVPRPPHLSPQRPGRAATSSPSSRSLLHLCTILVTVCFEAEGGGGRRGARGEDVPLPPPPLLPPPPIPAPRGGSVRRGGRGGPSAPPTPNTAGRSGAPRPP